MAQKNDKAICLLFALAMPLACKDGNEAAVQAAESSSEPTEILRLDEALSLGEAAQGETIPETVVDTKAPRVVLGNAASGGLLNSGFLAGSCLDDEGIKRVEVKIDDEPYQVALGGVRWRFPLPRGAAALRPDSIHAFSIRCIDTAGNVGMDNHVLLRLGVNWDIDGDGYADLVAASPAAPQPYQENSFASVGRLIVFSGSSEGLSSLSAKSGSGDHVFFGTGPFHRLGHAIAISDWNGDGYADVAASEPGYAAGQGRVIVVFGREDLPMEASISEVDSQQILGHAVTGSLGVSLSSGDTNGDGYADLMVGQGSSPGKVFVFHGGNDGLADGGKQLATSEAQATLIGGNASFARSLTVSDYNRDGFDDLFVTEPGSGGGGRVLVYEGSSGGLKSEASRQLRHADGEAYLNQVTAQDFDGDLRPDLAIFVGNGPEPQSLGQVFVVSGHDWLYASETDLEQLETENRLLRLTLGDASALGRAFASADYNRDGYYDLAVAAPDADGRGKVEIVFGYRGFFAQHGVGSAASKKNLLRGKSAQQPATIRILGADPNGQFGAMLAGDVDYNHDGFADLLVGSPGYHNNFVALLGRLSLFVLSPDSQGLTVNATQAAAWSAVGEVQGMALGSVLP